MYRHSFEKQFMHMDMDMDMGTDKRMAWHGNPVVGVLIVHRQK